MDKEQHKQITITGARWAIREQVINQLINFSVGIALARLLGPEIFGLFAMVMVFIGFLAVFKDLGLPEAIIQNKALNMDMLSGAFWLQVLFSLVLLGLLALLSGPIAQFYDQAILQKLSILIGFNFVIEALYASHSAFLQKQMNFKKLFYINVAATVLSGSVAVSMALADYGIWALVARLLIFSGSALLLFWMSSQWLPKLNANPFQIRSLLKFSLPLKATQVMNYVVRNIDDLLIGKYLSASALGAYNRAYTIMLMPLQHLSHVVAKVMFPSLSLIQTDRGEVRQIYLKMARVVASLTFPAMAVLGVLAEPFILAVLGADWSATIPVLQILCILGATQSIGTFNGVIFQSQGATHRQFRLHLFTKPFLTAMIIIGFFYTYHINGVALFYMMGSLTTLLISWRVVGRLIDSSLWEMLGNLFPLILPVILAGLTAFAVDRWMLPEAHIWLRLLIPALLSGLLYWWSIRQFAPKIYWETFLMIQKMLLAK